MAQVKLALKILTAVFAAIGVLYVAFVIYFKTAGPSCIGKTAAEVVSPDEQYVAIFLQVTCKDPFESHSEVSIAKRSEKTQAVALDERGTSPVDLRWLYPDELVLSYPRNARVEKYGQRTDGVWPPVTYRTTD
jgi:hypothetical protein